MLRDSEFWRTLLLGVAGVGQTLFVILYMTFSWWQSFLGRALFYKSLILCITLDVGVLARILGLTDLDWFFVVLYACFALGIWWQFLAFLRVKRAGRGTGMGDGVDGIQ